MIVKETVKCPNCNKSTRIKLKKFCEGKDVDDIISRKIFSNKCPKCETVFQTEYPLEINFKNYSISYLKKGENEDSLIKRECYDFDDFKEKILIFSNQLNDILIEFIKDFIKNMVDKEDDVLRFDSIDNSNIIFYSITSKEYLGFSIKNYENLLNHARIKKIKVYIEIDNDSYKKYIKVKK